MKKKTKFITQCASCQKVRRKEGFQFTNRSHMDEWDHHEEDLKKSHEEFDVIITHGLCDSCLKVALEENI